MSYTDLFSLFIAFCLLCVIFVFSFLKKKISLKDIEDADWKISSRSNGPVSLPKAEILVCGDMTLKYNFSDSETRAGEHIKITSKSRSGKIEVRFTFQTENVIDSFIPGVPYGSRNNQWAYELLREVHKVIKRYQLKRA